MSGVVFFQAGFALLGSQGCLPRNFVLPFRFSEDSIGPDSDRKVFGIVRVFDARGD